jgi:hypothetical protein
MWTKPTNVCAYYSDGGKVLCIYVNDILIIRTHLNVIKEVKEFFPQNIEMKDQGVVDVTLNIKLNR